MKPSYNKMCPMYCWKTKPIVKKQFFRFIFGLGQLCESSPRGVSFYAHFKMAANYRFRQEKRKRLFKQFSVFSERMVAVVKV